MTWPTEQAREAVQHMSCVWLDCPGPHDPRHGPDGPRIARKKADRILSALAPHVAALVRAERAAAWEEGVQAGFAEGGDPLGTPSLLHNPYAEEAPPPPPEPFACPFAGAPPPQEPRPPPPKKLAPPAPPMVTVLGKPSTP